MLDRTLIYLFTLFLFLGGVHSFYGIYEDLDFLQTYSSAFFMLEFLLIAVCILVPFFQVYNIYFSKEAKESNRLHENLSESIDFLDSLSDSISLLESSFKKKEDSLLEESSNNEQENNIKIRVDALVDTLKGISIFLENISIEDAYFYSFVGLTRLYEPEIRGLNNIVSNDFVCDKFLSDLDSLDFFVNKFQTLDSDLNKVRTLSTELKFQELKSFIVN